MINYLVIFEKTSGFWIFKKKRRFFYCIISSILERATHTGTRRKYALATMWHESYNAPHLSVDNYADNGSDATEMIALNGLICTIEDELGAWCISKIPL